VIQAERDVLRTLAHEIAEIAALPIQQQTRTLWKALNGLVPARPMALIDEVPWHEMDVGGELALQTQDDAYRGFEQVLREKLYTWRHMRLDMVVEPVIDVPKVIHSSGFGIETHERTLAVDPLNEIVSHEYPGRSRSWACSRSPGALGKASP
jgi:hypothetical protein